MSYNKLRNLTSELDQRISTLEQSGGGGFVGESAGGDLGGTYPNPTVNDGADGSAIHDNTAGEIAAIAVKGSPAVGDLLLIEDSADSNNKKRITIGSLPADAAPDQQELVAGKEIVDNPSGTVVLGQFVYDASLYTAKYSTFKFRVVASVTATRTGTVTLYNLTDGETVATLNSITATSPTKYESTLTVGTGAGNLKTSEKIYEVRASVTGADVADVIDVGGAFMKIEA